MEENIERLYSSGFCEPINYKTIDKMTEKGYFNHNFGELFQEVPSEEIKELDPLIKLHNCLYLAYDTLRLEEKESKGELVIEYYWGFMDVNPPEDKFDFDILDHCISYDYSINQCKGVYENKESYSMINGTLINLRIID